METFYEEFINQAIFRMDESSRMVNIALESLSEEEIWQRPNDSSNSIGNLILHLCGNITQYVISSLGEQEDIRERDQEFSAKGGLNKSELINKLADTVEVANNTMKSATLDQLLQERDVQGFQLSGIGIILHVVEHYSYHTGQIAFWTKQLKNKDLGFYEGKDLNAKNK
ncbi:MAG: DinB family protein [Aurantibacter sp.]